SFLVAESIRLGIREAGFAPGGQPWPLSVSIGGVAFNGPTTYHHMFQVADRHLYKAKSNGRDQVSFESPRNVLLDDVSSTFH
ncbi:MAG: GGDEF domain-containing protein, partial [Mesorhizobium sp.]